MLKFLIALWLLALLVDGLGSPLLGLYFWRLRGTDHDGNPVKIRMARPLALLAFGSSLEAWAMLVSILIAPRVPYQGALFPIMIRIVFRIIKTVPLFFVLADLVPNPKRDNV